MPSPNREHPELRRRPERAAAVLRGLDALAAEHPEPEAKGLVARVQQVDRGASRRKSAHGAAESSCARAASRDPATSVEVSVELRRVLKRR